jgi:NAD(P)H-hydrate epimerase
VTIAAPGPALGTVLAHTPELMTEALPDRDGAWKFSTSEIARVDGILAGKDAVVFGPGVGTSTDAKTLTEWLIGSSPVPMVIDADGLNCLSANLGWLAKRRSPIVLTPHPGEMSRLAGASTADVQSDRVGTARRFATEHGVTVVLKGARSVIASPTGMVSICPSGNPGMASGGMGDALSGVTAALLAQHVETDEAAEAAVFWHGAAADRVAVRRGEAGLLASDVIEELPPTLRNLQSEFYGDAADH